ncbi:hypothetical protein [Microbacterium paulum]
MANDLSDLADTMEVAATTRPGYDMAIGLEVAEIFVHMLGDGRSVIDPTAVIWTAEAAEELRRRIEDNPILGTDAGQWDKLEHQLAGAPREVVLLAAELVFLREQPVFNAAPATRREHLTRVLKMSEPVASVPEWMSGCLDRPTERAGFRGGQGYNGRLWLHLIWAATFVREWRGWREAERSSAKSDPWRMQQIMLDAGDSAPDFRNAMQFLAFPAAFDPISSTNMKTRIRSALADRIGGSSGDDSTSGHPVCTSSGTPQRHRSRRSSMSHDLGTTGSSPRGCRPQDGMSSRARASRRSGGPKSATSRNTPIGKRSGPIWPRHLAPRRR